jgi:hypothetical protein
MNYLFGSDGTGLDREDQALIDRARLEFARYERHRHLAPRQETQISLNVHRSWRPPRLRIPKGIKRRYELGCNVYITRPVNYESFATAIRQLGPFFSVIQVPRSAT